MSKKNNIIIPKLERKIVKLPNPVKDKFVKEKWTKGRNLALFPHPTRIIFCGNVGTGKTTTAMNVFLAHQSSNRPFEELYIATCTTDNLEYQRLEPTAVMSVLPDPTTFDIKKKTLLIIDDFEFAKMNKRDANLISTLFRYTSSHCNLSIYLCFQSFFNIPSICRKLSTVYVLWKPRSKLELTLMANRAGIDVDILRQMFNEICQSHYDSITIDHTVRTPAKFRLNIYNKLLIQEVD